MRQRNAKGERRQRREEEGERGEVVAWRGVGRAIVSLLGTRPRPPAAATACLSPLSAATDRNVNSVAGRKMHECRRGREKRQHLQKAIAWPLLMGLSIRGERVRKLFGSEVERNRRSAESILAHKSPSLRRLSIRD